MTLFFATPAAAQSPASPSAWTYEATIYTWLSALESKVDTRFGEVDGKLSARDVLSHLDFALMGTIEARRGPWAIIVDGLYTDLSATQSTPFGALFSDAKVETELALASGYLTYRIYDKAGVAIDVGGGFRAFDLDVNLKLNPGRRPGESRKTSKVWAVPVAAARMTVPFDDKWSVTAFADFGGTGSDDQTWQALASVNYQFNEKWSARLGYREMDLENVIGGRKTSINLSGPFIAGSYRF